jgi:hypothetical protein
MKFRAVVILVAVGLIGACDQQAKTSRTPTLQAQASRAVAAMQTSPQAQPSGSVAPKDAQWTIYCASITGPNHVEQANQVKADLMKMSALRDWYVIHQEAESVLYYGFYRAYNDQKDAKESARAQTDRKSIANLPDKMDNRPFARAMFVPIDAPDPAAPKEWNLANAKGYWSLQIAAYKDSPQRKAAAVEAVRAARAQGVEAYYFHGPTSSSVCIGAWPREALREQDSDRGEAIDPTQDILVLEKPLPFNTNVDVRNRETGEKVRTYVPRVEPQDPTLIAAMRQYPEHSVNGVVNTKTMKDRNGNVHQIADPSFLVKIPERETSIFTSVPQETPPTLIAPPTASGAGGTGRLRSIGQ